MTASAQRSMGLGELTDVISPDRVVGLPVGAVSALHYDSREVQAGSLFFAVPGDHVDGHDFLPQAVANGAVAVVVERETAEVAVPRLIVDRTRRALADAADAWYGRPSERLTVIGVTGTDGKSTTTALAAELLACGGRRPGQIGTVWIGIGESLEPNEARTTTPEAPELHALLARMVTAGNDAVVMEATSHGLALERTRNCRFDVGVVTTVTSEHLEFHGTLDAYRAAKARLIEEAPIAALNVDDAAFDYFRARARGAIVTYGIETNADLRATGLTPTADGTRFDLATPAWRGEVELALPGGFNVSNALAALAVAHVLELDLGLVIPVLRETRGVPGRMERIDQGQPFSVIVDYAHTADSLRKALTALRPEAPGRLIAVFGSAGERDATKRPAMGRVAAEEADVAIVTDEDPRLEDPHAINEAIAAGARGGGARDGETLFVIDDRREAIAHAVSIARPGDLVLLAGKGHEASIFYGTRKVAWDDRQAAREALAAAGWADAGAD